MGFRDFAQSLRPGNDRELAAKLQREETERRRRKEDERRKLIRAMSDADAKRTPEQKRASAERARNGKRELGRKGSGARLF